ncbi:MAG TPA: hypothetical protein VFM70_04390 [Salinimicrobium sp.]|nr:hypothetical protein [Salinimicrobium sp.]
MTRLNINNCIVLGDFRRLQQGKPLLRNIKGLSVEMEMSFPGKYDADKVYSVIYAKAGKGFKETDKELLNDLGDVLLLEEHEMEDIDAAIQSYTMNIEVESVEVNDSERACRYCEEDISELPPQQRYCSTRCKNKDYWHNKRYAQRKKNEK